jgi:arylsulfatase A
MWIDWGRGKRALTNCGVILLIMAAVVAIGLRSMAADEKAPRPNMVIIFIDDLGYGDIGPYGATKQKTPHLDRMASEGMKLTSFYAAPVCSVSRAQLLTGCYGARVSVPGVYGPGSKNGLHPEEWTIADRLKPLGYATACVGKWHVGDQPEFLPTRQGFDQYLGIPYSNDMQRPAAGSGQRVVPLVRNDRVQELLSDEQQSRIVERYTDEAVKFIRDHQASPFFLYLPHTAVHTPIWPGEAFRGKSANGRFGDWVEEVDWSVGRILDTLRELRLDKQTLVVFTSDNGPWLIKGADGGSAAPLRGGKGSTWEGGVRVPTIAWWPGHIAPGTTCKAVAGTIDLLPTAVSIAGGKLPDEPVIDGRDLSPLLMGKTQDSPREAHYYFSGYNLQAIRQGPWKLALAPQPESMGKGTSGDAVKNPRLYNLDEEINEQTDLAEKHPEIVARLRKLAEKMSAEIGGNLPTARRPPGSVEQPTTLYPSEDPQTPAKNKARTKAAKNANRKPVDIAMLRVGDQTPGESAPRVVGLPFTLSFRVTTQARDGILVAHGGAAVGYALHLRDGKLVFTTHDKGARHDVELAFPPSKEARQVTARLTQDGKLTLRIDEGETVEAKSSGVLSRQPQEDFCVGFDSEQPVAVYSRTQRFDGVIESLRWNSP